MPFVMTLRWVRMYARPKREKTPTAKPPSGDAGDALGLRTPVGGPPELKEWCISELVEAH